MNVNDGTGFANAPAGTTISFTINGAAARQLHRPSARPARCSITHHVGDHGRRTVNASTTVNVGGVSLTRTTNGVAPNSGPAVKTWVNAKISITPDATNRVGAAAHVHRDADEGHGQRLRLRRRCGRDGRRHADELERRGRVRRHGPFTGTTNASGQFPVTFNSQTTGKVTGHASSTLTIGSPSVPFTVQTDGTGLNSADAVKTYVDARISITPNATNEVGQPHTFTVTRQEGHRDGDGFVAGRG